MDYFVSHLLLLLTIVVVLMLSSSVDVQSQGRVTSRVERDEIRRPVADNRHRRRLHKTPEDAIRRQIERVKEKILSQLSYSVWTAPSPGSVRSPLPQPLLHMYDIDIARHGAESAIIDTDDTGRSRHGIQATRDVEHESKFKQAKLIVFGHESKYTTVAQD